MNAKSESFSSEERAAMKARNKELKAAANKEEAAAAVLEAIDGLSASDRPLAKRLHEIITTAAPSLSPKTWYGMPAYANDEGKTVCFFQGAEKFKTRYATFGFSDLAQLDDGEFWPTSYAVNKLTPAVEKQIIALLKRATG